MCAGKGIIHAEMPIHVPGSPDPRGLQLWVDLPKQVRFFKYNMAVKKIWTADRIFSTRWWYGYGSCLFKHTDM